MAWFLSKKDFDKDKDDERKLEPLFKEAIGYGAVHAIFHLDAHGKEQGAIKDSLVDFVSRLSQDEGVLYCKGEIDEVVGSESEGFSSNAEIQLLTDSFATMLRMALRYGPVAVEIVAPHEIKLNVQEMQDLLLGASEISKQYAAYVVEKVWGKEELEKYKQRVTKQLGEAKKMREHAEQEQSKK